MPIYGYRCSQCGHELEALQSMSAPPLRECSECGGALEKILYPVGVHFKGSGFYSTDYKNGGSSAKAGSSASSSSDSDSKASDGKSETKAEPSSDKAKAEPSTSKE